MKHLLLSLSLLAISAQVNGSNFYAGLSIGSANTGGPEILYESYFPGQRIEGNSGVISIYTGYNINKNISFELGYSNLEKMRTSIKVDHSVNTLEPANNIFSINSEKVFLNTKLQHHINNKISAFGIVGYSFYDITYKATGSWTPTSESKSKEEFTFGLGGQYQFNDQFSGRLQWTRDTPGDLEINTYQASVEMSF